MRAFNTTAKSHVGTRDRAGGINAPRRKCVTRGCLLALGTEICTFKDTDQIASVLPSTDSHEIIRYQILVPENAFGLVY